MMAIEGLRRRQVEGSSWRRVSGGAFEQVQREAGSDRRISLVLPEDLSRAAFE